MYSELSLIVTALPSWLSFTSSDPVSVGVQVYEPLLGDKLVLSQAGLLIQHEGKGLVLHSLWTDSGVIALKFASN